MIELRPVDDGNRAAVCALRVRPEQKSFVADNEFSLGQAALQPACVPLAVCDGETPVGFVMYALDPDDGEYWIFRVMVDAAAQGRGIGRAAMEALLARIGAEAPGRDLYISFEPENDTARALYASFGFLPDGWSADGEEVWCLRAVPVCVRALAPDDAAAVCALGAGQTADGQCGWVVREDGGAVCGCLRGHPETAAGIVEVLPDGARYFELDTLCVAAGARGCGFGTALFKHMKHVVMAAEEAEALLYRIPAEDDGLSGFFIRQGMERRGAFLLLPL